MGTEANPFASLFPFAWPSWPPATLTQPILPGWTFGNITINAQNSSAPQTEVEIVAAESYGRQIGKLLDAVAELIARQDGAEPKAFADVLALRDKVEAIKTASAKHRIEQVVHDLDRLKQHDRQAYDAEVAALRALLKP
jgi:hypothetical protein